MGATHWYKRPQASHLVATAQWLCGLGQTSTRSVLCRPFRDSEVAEGCSEMKRTPSQPLSLTALDVFLRFRSLFCKMGWGQRAGLLQSVETTSVMASPLQSRCQARLLLLGTLGPLYGFLFPLQAPPE